MGCDIHIFSESKKGGKWVCNEPFETDREELDDGEFVDYLYTPYHKRFYTGRNYELFGLLAGVRRPHLQQFDVKGIPEDADPLVSECFNQWGIDAHTPSFITLAELKNKISELSDVTCGFHGMMDKWQKARIDNALLKGSVDWNLLYPCAGWSSRSDWVEFTYQVPVLFFFGETLNKWVEKLESFEGEDHRLVFWFDN